MAMAKLNEFFEPKKNSTYERHMFRILKQEKGEKIGMFAMRLRSQAERCEFGDNLEENIKDQIIEKCLSTKLRRELLKLGDTNLDKVLKAAKIFEAIEEQSKTFDPSESNKSAVETGVNKIDSKSNFKRNQMQTQTQTDCSRCGYTGHSASDEKCSARGKKCNKCGGRDHFSRKCRSRKRARTFENKPPQSKENSDRSNVKQESHEPPEKKANTNDTIKMIEGYQSNVKDDYIFCITTGSDSMNEITCKIGGVEVKAVIDSGSKYNIVDANAWEFLKSKQVIVANQRKSTNQSFSAYGGHPLSIVGIFEAKIETPYKQHVADFYVLKDYGKILIGYDTGIPLGVLKIGEDVNHVEQTSQLTKMKGIVIEIPINKEVKPVVQPYRRVPVPLEDAVDKKIDELLQKGIIEKVKQRKTIV